MRYSALLCIIVRYSVIVRYSALQCIAVRYSVL